jgi:hypothetical protein
MLSAVISFFLLQSIQFSELCIPVLCRCKTEQLNPDGLQVCSKHSQIKGDRVLSLELWVGLCLGDMYNDNLYKQKFCEIHKLSEENWNLSSSGT